nr:MAG TPA: hemolysin [Caudoviricetes sp.]
MENIMREYEGRITAVEQSTKSIHRRLDDIENLVESIFTIANEIKHMREDLNDVKERVDIIEEKPIKHWNLLVTTITTALVSGLLGMFLAKLTGG